MFYETRVMVARKPFTYEGVALEPGDTFYAAPPDAGYFVKHGRASEVAPSEVKVVPVPDTPQVAEVDSVAVGAGAEGDSPATISTDAPVVAVKRPRGRPRKVVPVVEG